LVLLPLLTVLAITAIKDGWEDIKRHQSDRRVNHSHVRVLAGANWINPNFMGRKARTFVRGLPRRRPKPIEKEKDGNQDVEKLATGTATTITEVPEEAGSMVHVDPSDPGYNRPHWRRKQWEDLHVGDVVKIMNNESLPADVLICASSDPEGVAFVETKNLDGETNLKSRNAVPALSHLRTARDCADKENAFHIECGKPDENMFRLTAAVVSKGKKYPVELQMTLLRGTVLRNTDWVIGVVLYTGADTKIVLNSGGTPSKRSRVERQMNPQV
jgi:phospholipid-translocating ATPase